MILVRGTNKSIFECFFFILIKMKIVNPSKESESIYAYTTIISKCTDLQLQLGLPYILPSGAFIAFKLVAETHLGLSYKQSVLCRKR